MKRIGLIAIAFSLISLIYEARADDAVGITDKGTLTYMIGDSQFDFKFRLTIPEWFASKNVFLLNNQNDIDRSFFIRHTIDTSLHYGYGLNAFGHEIVQLHMNMRDRGIWGNQEAIAMTTDNAVKAYEVRFGEHNHGIARHIWWIRELWIDFDINNVFNFAFKNDHFITLGAFSYELGRGIAFGDAYEITPDPVLGFSPRGAVDQYAFGGRLYGDIIPIILGYDLYGAILNNKAASFSDTAAKIRGEEFGKKFDQFRGFGIVNFALAGKLRWKPVDTERCAVYVEPYWLFNDDPEQKVEWIGDASSKLGTIGCAGEFAWGNVEFGFDLAFNTGRQEVKGIDRNITDQENRDGFVSVINTAVDLVINPGEQNETTRRLPYRLVVVNSQGMDIDVQTVINTSPQAANQNGAVLLDNVTLDDVLVTGETNPVPVRIVNGKARFRDPFTNNFCGSMTVVDACYWLYKRDLKISGAMGFATGAPNPNRDIKNLGDSQEDTDFCGFIGLQEFYNGTRVRSAFFLSGAGRVPRALDFPSENVNDRFASTVQRFTNIVFIGTSLWYLPEESEHKVDINPNLLMYWQESRSRRFDPKAREKNEMLASSFLGVESNLFFNMEVVEDLRFFYKFSIFFPGQHYKDIKGLPINREQQRFIDQFDKSGVVADREPKIGDDTAFATNFGLEYRF